MDEMTALRALAALAQETRLRAFRLLVQHEPQGLAAGMIADELGVPQNTLSSHLAILVHAGLASSRRESRNIIYRADLAAMAALVAYLLENCCNGGTCALEIAEPLLPTAAADEVPCPADP